MAQSGGGGRGSGLNANHARALHATAVAVDRLLGEIEALAVAGESPLRRYVDDLTPVQKQVLIAFTRAAHARMVGALAQLGVPPPAPGGSARGSARNALTFADIALQEVEPSRLRGYGTLGAEAEAAIERMLADVAATLTGVREFLGESAEVDLSRRIARLDDIIEKDELTLLEQTIRDRGLVSLRRPLQALVEQLESGTYEIAVFGRVSSGKSSLLNAVLGWSVLPVGITPVTSVPTRLVWGESPSVTVRVTGAPEDRSVPLDGLREFVTEDHNAGNAKRVERVTVALPVERLRGGVALVDTPGLGALASSGAREAYAYMPRCDLGVIVVDGGGTFEAGDVDLARALIDSGIEIEVVISKADRVGDPDRVALAHYVHDQLLDRLGVDAEVHWISSVEPHAAVARSWFDLALAPRITRSRELAAESVKRKLTTLRGLVERASQREAAADDGAGPTLERIGGEAARFLEARRRATENAIAHSRDMALDVIRPAATILSGEPGASAEQTLREMLVSRTDRERHELRLKLIDARDRLRAWLDQAGRAADVAIDRDVVALDVTDMPSVEVPPELLDLKVAASRFLLHRERRIAEKLAESVGPALEAALRRFETRLRDWSRSAFARLGAQFASQMEPLRVRVPNAASASATVEGSEPSGVHKRPDE